MPAAGSTTWRVGRRTMRVSHLDKLYWPDDGLTKGDLLGSDRTIAPTMLPPRAQQPLTLRVFPDGICGPSFSQRDRPEPAPARLGRVADTPEKSEWPIQLPLVDEEADLIWLAHRGCLEVHGWSARTPQLTEPDQAVFDLDPGDAATLDDVLNAALRVRAALEGMHLRDYAKTSGRRGIHVHVLLAPGHDFARVRAWVKTVAEHLAANAPKRIVVARGATHRGCQIAIDSAIQHRPDDGGSLPCARRA